MTIGEELVNTELPSRARLGFDIGKVILSTDTNNAQHISDFDHTTYISGAKETLKHLVEDSRIEDVFLISKCGIRVETHTRDFLERTAFYERTGIVRQNVYFCRQRAEKAKIAAELLLTHFIDDRCDVLNYMQGIVDNRYLFIGDAVQSGASREGPRGSKVVAGWHNLWQTIQNSLE